MRIYLAAPFFDPEQLDRLAQVRTALEQNPTVTAVFSPMHHTNAAGLTENTPEWQQLVFNEDVGGLEQADAVVAVLDYAHQLTDPGTAFEIGYAYANKMPVVGVAVTDVAMNLMFQGAMRYFTRDIAALATVDFGALPSQPYVGPVF
ncbi:nucleoside 2-deoxyribosyltransferase [Lacticaseibacillus saniviri]|uniref:Nucleoside 2-deoxyribosyltransferase n=2 Tax=Lacticaseibacillus saniviri TaxID=931533 RepID=A0A0R2N0W0_9LACO|nr:nucleoside 2-deoxyribosyltransferase [Lacticaseibacillus saniviri]KRO18032.1 Nucleoside 2-deoxyribosyltransferase [Lacticaseibacillus saniviri JCM 17471 = DSM 24301]MCG4281488.1 nucleoside 2-deoxyribosyltransferase [Lacticaseibacillus saniviri]